MNVKEIMDQAIELTGITIDQFKTRRYINDAINILISLYDTACNKATTAIICTDINSEYSLPSDCFTVDKVKLENYKYKDYLVSGNIIQFEDTGTFTVRYNVNTDLEDVKIYEKKLDTDIPPVHDAYHRAICFYVAAQLLDVNDPKAVLFTNRFNTISDDMNKKLIKQKRNGARIKAPLFR